MPKIKQIVNKKPSCKGVASFYIIFEGCADKEPKGASGITHLAEHCICEPMKEIEEQAYADGITMNAFTSQTSVAIYCYGLQENIAYYRDWLCEKLLTYIPPQDVFEREKEIVLTEYKLAMSDQQNEFFNNLNRKYFNQTKPIGIYSEIENVSYDTFIEFYKTIFKAPTKIISFSKDKFIPKTPITFSPAYKVKYCKYGLYSEYATEHNVNTPTEIIMKFINLNYNYWKKDITKLFYLDIWRVYLSEGLTSPLVSEIRENLKAAYYIGATLQFTPKHNALFYIISQIEKDNIELVANAIDDVIAKTAANLSEERFNYVVKSLKSSMELKLRQDTNANRVRKLLKGDSSYIPKFLKTEFTFERFKQEVNIYKNWALKTELSSTI